MFKFELASKENLVRSESDELQVETVIAAYKVYIEKAFDKEGLPQLNKNGSQRYYAVSDDEYRKLESEVVMKKVRENVYKPVYDVNGEKVEKVDREEKHVYYVVDEDRLATLAAGTVVKDTKSGLVKVLDEVGYALVDITDEAAPRIIAVKPFETENQEAEAKQAVDNCKFQHRA